MIPKATQDKISKYRQKIKQSIINEQSAGHIVMTPRQPISSRQYDNYPKINSSLSRSNIRKNPIDSQPVKNYQEQELSYPQQKIHRSRIFQQNNPEPAKTEYQIKISDPKYPDQIRTMDQRTIQKPSTSRSPTNRNPYLQERQVITKRKTSTMESSLQGENRGYFPNTSNFQNLSSFDTFNQKPMVSPSSSVLPPLFPPVSPSNTSGQQVKVLLQENQILSLHLNQKMQRIRTLQKELKAVVKSEILHEQKYDIEVSQLVAQNSMIKKSTDEQVRTLVMQVKKLNDQLVQKQQQWQERLNKVRKTNLDQFQQNKKNQMLMEQKYKAQIQSLVVQIAIINEEFKASKQSANTTIQNLKAQNASLNQAIEKLAHVHKMQKSQLTLNHDNLLRQTKQEHFRKVQIINLDRIRKENQLQNNIEYLSKEMSKLQDQLSLLKHEKQFSQVKEMQQRGKMMIELREEKQKIQQLKHQENNKLQKISQTQLQTLMNSYQSQLEQLRNTITNLQKLLQTRGVEIQNLYKQISDTRTNYQQEILKRQAHMQNMKQKMQDMGKKHLQEQQCLKIKMAQLTQSNQTTIKQLYQKHIKQIKHLNLDKDQIIKSLRQKVSNQFLQIEQNNLLHYQEIKQMQTKIEKLQQQLSQNALKQRNMNVNMDKESIILKENLLRQSEAYEKAASVKEENMKRLQKIIETKDKQIQELQEKLQLLKKTHKDQISLQKDQYEATIRERDDAIVGLKVELEYSRKQQFKRAQQFSHDKEYYSNQMKQLKNKSEKDFNDWLENLSSQINQLKTENHDLKYQLQHLQKEYQEYKNLWNQKETLNKMGEKEKQFIEKLNSTFTSKYQKLIDSYEKDIEANYKPKIRNLNELILEKQQQINDMKTNYHELQVKFQRLMEDKQTLSTINDQVLSLGRSTSVLANHFVTLGK